MPLIKKIIIGLLLIVSANLFAQEIVTDRPDQTESSQTVGFNNLQIESGIVFENEGNGVRNFYGPSTLVRYGISKNIELRFVNQFQSTAIKLANDNVRYSGFNDVEIGAKIQVFKKENVNTEIAFLSHIVLPTAKTSITTNAVGVVNKLSISHAINNRVNLGYNIGFDYVERENALTYSLALGIAISKKVGFYIEPYGTWGETNTIESNFDTGLTYLAHKNLQFDVSFGKGINSKMNYVSVGFSWRALNAFRKSKS